MCAILRVQIELLLINPRGYWRLVLSTPLVGLKNGSDGLLEMKDWSDGLAQMTSVTTRQRLAYASEDVILIATVILLSYQIFGPLAEYQLNGLESSF